MLCTTVDVVAMTKRSGVAAHRHPHVAADQRDEKREHGCLREPDVDVLDCEAILQPREEGGRRDVELRAGDQHRAEQAHHVADEDEQRHRHHQRDDAR